MMIISRKIYRTLASFTLILLLIQNSFAQTGDVDFLRSTGKIYSVIAGIVIIFVLIIFYLWRIDNKLTKLENHIKDEH